MELKSLNDKQVEAVRATEGRVRIIAGAGSGKTRVLAYRYAYLVEELGIDPGNILCLTFTNKAALEMRNRIGSLIGGNYASDFICTIHSFCVKFLREEIFRLGYPKTFQILDEEDMKAIVKEAHEELGLERKESTVERFLKSFYKIKAFSRTSYIPGFLLPGASNAIDSNTAQYISNNCDEMASQLYVLTLMRQRKFLSLDFEDLISFTIYILNQFPDVKDKWQSRMNYVMVDEVQDCNDRDWEIYETIAEKYGNLFLVGDPDQTIYEWRGAHLEKFVAWKPQTDVVMAQNYRSTSTILDAANSIIENNDLRIKKDLFTANRKGEKIIHFHAKDDRQEADWISEKIKQLIKSGSFSSNHTSFSDYTSFSDFAVLVRSSYLTRAIEQSFMRNKIMYVIWGGVRFFERREIKDALSYLRLIAFDDELSFKRIVNVPSRKIGKKSIEKIEKCAAENGCSMFEALKKLYRKGSFANENVRNFIEVIESAKKLSGQKSISNLLEYVLNNSGLNELYRNDEEEERLENLNELMQSIKTYETEHQDDEITLETYLQEIALYTNLDYNKGKNHVKVMTIHQSKGLEFPYVFISGLTDGIFPNKRSVRERKKRAMEEERRLMYVAVTRAEKQLFLTESEGYSVQGGFNKVPSRFIREIKNRLITTEGHIDQTLWNRATYFIREMDSECGLESSTSQTTVLAGSIRQTTGLASSTSQTNGLAEGDSVSHKIFGNGTIKRIYNNGEYCEVNFHNFGIRSLKTEKIEKK